MKLRKYYSTVSMNVSLNVRRVIEILNFEERIMGLCGFKIGDEVSPRKVEEIYLFLEN